MLSRLVPSFYAIIVLVIILVPSLSLSKNGATNQHSNKVITKDHLILATIFTNDNSITFDKAMDVKTAKVLIVHLLNYVYLEMRTNSPSMQPSYIPSEVPSFFPTDNPTIRSSKSPTKLHSIQPSWVPSYLPSKIPSLVPSLNPSNPPSMFPSSHLSDAPSSFPSGFNRMKYCADDPYYFYNRIESKEYQCEIFAISEYRCKIVDAFGQHVGSRCPKVCGLCGKLLKKNDSTAGPLREKTDESTLEPTALTLSSYTTSTFNREHECVDDENFYYNKIYEPENKCKSFAITSYRCKSTDRYGRKIKERCPATCGICAKKLIRDGSSVEPLDDTASTLIPLSITSMQSMIPSTVPSSFQSPLPASQGEKEKICMDNPEYYFNNIFKNGYKCKDFATSVFRCSLIDASGKKIGEECPFSCGLCDEVSFEKSSKDEHGFGNFEGGFEVELPDEFALKSSLICEDKSDFYFDETKSSEYKCDEFAITSYRCNLIDKFGRRVATECPVSCNLCNKTPAANKCKNDENYYFNKFRSIYYKCDKFAINEFRCNLIDGFGLKVSEKCLKSCNMCN